MSANRNLSSIEKRANQIGEYIDSDPRDGIDELNQELRNTWPRDMVMREEKGSDYTRSDRAHGRCDKIEIRETSTRALAT